MGHEILEYGQRHVFIHDMDIWALRHFLLIEAEAVGNTEFAAFVRGWEWLGPGVYLGLDFDSLLKGDLAREHAFVALLEAARARIQSFGEFVPLDYLATHVNLKLAYFTEAQPVSRWVRWIDELRDIISSKPRELRPMSRLEQLEGLISLSAVDPEEP